MTAGDSYAGRETTNPGANCPMPATALSKIDNFLRTSSRWTSTAAMEISAASASNLASSIKRRAVTMHLTLAVCSALIRLAAPLVKFSIAGMRPKAETAKKVITAPTLVGSMMPTDSPRDVPFFKAWPSASAARTISS